MSDMVPQKFERHVSRIGGTSGGLGRGGHTRSLWGKILIENIHSPGACWVWRGYLDKDGYGKLTVKGGRTVRANRWVWQQEQNAVARGEILISLCGRRECVNPAHKKIGTQADAIKNLHESGRAGEPPDNRGELSARAKLKAEDVEFIRAQPGAYGLVPVLARLFAVSTVTISKIRARAAWKHLGNGNAQNAMRLADLRALADQRDRERGTIDDYAQTRTA